MLNLCYDQLVLPTVGYPNLAKHQALPFTQEWREFDTHWPCVVPLRLTMYLDAAHIQYGVYTVAEAPAGSWSPVAFSWFDFSCDYFSMLSPILRSRIVKKEIRIMNPEICQKNSLFLKVQSQSRFRRLVNHLG
jgi:hypothetical protein